MAYSSILAYTSVASSLHLLSGLPSPFAGAIVHLFLHGGVRRVLGKPPVKARLIEPRDLLALYGWAIAKPTPRRVKVLFDAVLAFHCALRIANVIPETKLVARELFSPDRTDAKTKGKEAQLIRRQHIVRTDRGLVVTVPASKTDNFKDRPHKMLIPPFPELGPIDLGHVLDLYDRVVRPEPHMPVCAFGPAASQLITRETFLKSLRSVLPPRPAVDNELKGLLREDVTLHSPRRGCEA